VSYMPQPQTVSIKPVEAVISRVLEIVTCIPGCRIEYVAGRLPDLTLREVCYILSYLRRKGLLDLNPNGQGGVTVSPTCRLFH
jgi:hypothetical protein